MKKTTAALLISAFAATQVIAQEAVDLSLVSPALSDYQQRIVEGNLWQREALTPRDRSVVTVAALIARQQTADLAAQVELALDNGVTPAEISEIVTHLAFYAGWGNAIAATTVISEVFSARGIAAEDLPEADVELLPLNEQAEAARAGAVANSIGPISPGLEQFTADPLFRDLWLRPDLAPRDRSLVTVTALIANGQVGQIGFHLGRAMDNGLTAEQAGEVLAQLAFYSGWPSAFSAAPVVGEVLQRRSQ